MNQRPTGLNVTKAITGFLQYKSAEGLSPVPVSGYERDLKLWIEYQGDMDVAEVETTHILSYLNYLRTDYVPRRITGNNSKKLSPKTVYNLYISVASFFTWASREFNLNNPMKGIPRPRVPEDAPIEPFKKEEIELLIKACDFCEEALTDRRRKFIMQRSTSKRDKAIILTLLDTGLRAGELCALRVEDVDMKSGKIRIRLGDAGKAKSGKGRIVYMGKSARRFLWRYLAEREGGEDPDAPLFVVREGRPFNPSSTRHITKSKAARAGVKDAHPHRFRHTGATTYLRSGGDVFILQSLLGHGSLEMVRHYARIAQVDVEQAYRKASPADKGSSFTSFACSAVYN